MAEPRDAPPFSTPPQESSRFPGNDAMFSIPEREQSGGLPDAPRDMPVDATGESSATPWRITQGG